MFKYFVSIKDKNKSLKPLLKLSEESQKLSFSIEEKTQIQFFLCVLTNENKKIDLHFIGNLFITERMKKKNPKKISICTYGYKKIKISVEDKNKKKIFKAMLSLSKFIKKTEKLAIENKKEQDIDENNSLKDRKIKQAFQKPAKSKNNKKLKQKKEELIEEKHNSIKTKKSAHENGKEKIVLKVRHPISAKLIHIITMIECISLGFIIALVNYYVSGDVQLSAEENNFNSNTNVAMNVENLFETAISSTKFFLNLNQTNQDHNFLQNSDEQLTSNNEFNNELTEKERTKNFFETNQDIAGIFIPGYASIENKNFFLSHEIDSQMVFNMIESENEKFSSISEGETSILNVSPYFNRTKMIAIAISADELIQKLQNDETLSKNHSQNSSVLIILYSTEKISEFFEKNKINKSFLINEEGTVLSHPQEELVTTCANLSGMEIVQLMQTGSVQSQQLLFKDENGKEFFGAYTKLKIGDSVVITTISKDTIFESIRNTTRRNIYLSAAVLAIAILIIWFFSKSISSPIKKLADAAKLIQNGEYNIRLKAKHQDEVGLLTTSFIHMSKGLAERERLKDTFGRFTNKAIAEKAMNGELELGGETKNATIFFSDIRSFTSMSEKLSPEDVVKFLNDYMTRMVECVNKTGGTVDKFIGDAIMAVWGAPISGKTPQEDALNAIRAALYMRASLAEYNAIRISKGENPIRIGCGINSGSVVAGQIGSKQRMEYTCIGDTVNLASRTESLNKPFATDILITGNTYELVKDFVQVEKMLPVSVKGKEKLIDMYAVVNMPYETQIPYCGKNGPSSMNELRKRWGIQEPDLKGINTDDEEQKFHIQNN